MAEALGRPHIVADGRWPQGDPERLPPPRGGAGDWRFYTSGTTAEPKGARHTDETLEAATLGMVGHLRMTASDVLPRHPRRSPT